MTLALRVLAFPLALGAVYGLVFWLSKLERWAAKR